MSSYIHVTQLNSSDRIHDLTKTQILLCFCNNFKDKCLQGTLSNCFINRLKRGLPETVRTLFDGILSDFADKNLTHYLGNDGICVYSSFENAIVAVIECKTLSTENENELEVFKKPIELPIEQNDDKSYAESLLDQKRRKPMSHYGDLKWIPPTSNLAERLFSRVKYVFNDHRKSLLPVNLESRIFLCVNRSFWDAKTIEDLM